MDYIKAFIIGGIICAIAQVLIDRTKLTSARILVLYVCLGCILGGLGIYKPLVDFSGAGATVPLTGFGYNLSLGVMREVDEIGLMGIFTGGIKATAGGITAAMLFGYIVGVLFDSKEKS